MIEGLLPEGSGQFRSASYDDSIARQKHMAEVENLRNAMKKEAQIASDPWVHRSEGMRCKTCIWFVPKQRIGTSNSDVNALIQVGRCRRHAPTMNGYPVVYMTDWCGDHRIDENKV